MIDVPLVTVIMPIRNEQTYIARSLGAILAQDYPPERIEILVVDGMSDDNTRALVQQMFAEQHQRGAAWFALLLLDNPSKIVPPALNIGLQQARGEVIVRVDGHCEIAPDYVRRCVELLQETGADNVGGLQRSIGEGQFDRAVSIATSSPFGIGNARFRYAVEPGWADTVYLGAYRREVFERIGGFDEELMRNQDDEFNFRLTQSGGKIWLDPSIRSVYYSRASLRKLWRQYFQYGFYKVRVIQKRGGVASMRHLVPATFVVALVASLLLSLLTRRKLPALGVAGPYAAANLAASLYSGREDWSKLPMLPIIFFTLHAAYGSGFLLGMRHWAGKPVTPAPKLTMERYS